MDDFHDAMRKMGRGEEESLKEGKIQSISYRIDFGHPTPKQEVTSLIEESLEVEEYRTKEEEDEEFEFEFDPPPPSSSSRSSSHFFSSPPLITSSEGKVCDLSDRPLSCGVLAPWGEVVVGGTDHALYCTNSRLALSRQLFSKRYGHSEWVTDVIISSEGNHVISAAMDGKICVW